MTPAVGLTPPVPSSSTTPPGCRASLSRPPPPPLLRQPPVLIKLPSEILRHIFSFVPYFDLKYGVKGTCRKFSEILSNKSKTGDVDKVLFRDTPSSSIKNLNTTYKVHPIFKMLRYPYTSYDNGAADDTFFYLDLFILNIPAEERKATDKGKEYTGTTTSSIKVCGENAVSPAASKLVIHVADYPPITIDKTTTTTASSSSSVTVSDVTDAIMLLLCQPILNCRLNVLMENGRWRTYQTDGELGPGIEAFQLRRRGELTKGGLMTKGYGCKWEGVYKMQVLEGVVHLYVLKPPAVQFDIHP